METIRSVHGMFAFVKVAQTGSFSKAAQALGVSKSHVSKTVGYLEKELGVPLLLRTTRSVQLTQWGERYFQSCQQAMEQLEVVRHEITDQSKTPRGHLRVSLAGIFAEEYVAPVLIEMAKSYPDLKIDLNFSSRAVDLIAEKFDVAIRFGELRSSSLVAQKIASRREYTIASPDYLRGRSEIQKPQDLQKHNCLGEKLVWTYRSGGRTNQISLQGNLSTNNPRVVLLAVLAGLGVARLPGAYVFEEIKNGKLVPLLENFSEGKKDIWAVTPMRKSQNINVQIFIKELKNHLKKHYGEVLF